ncbi:hypothetical protein DXG01_004538 [Tephrocybe rancida]|nr:hypothetical protein DXG01_004538 [Tephrocybe rancida]
MHNLDHSEPESYEALKACALTSRALVPEVQRHIFSELYMSAGYHCNKTASLLCESPHLAKYVQHLEIREMYVKWGTTVLQEQDDLTFILMSLPNLQALEFTNIDSGHLQPPDEALCVLHQYENAQDIYTTRQRPLAHDVTDTQIPGIGHNTCELEVLEVDHPTCVEPFICAHKHPLREVSMAQLPLRTVLNLLHCAQRTLEYFHVAEISDRLPLSSTITAIEFPCLQRISLMADIDHLAVDAQWHLQFLASLLERGTHTVLQSLSLVLHVTDAPAVASYDSWRLIDVALSKRACYAQITWLEVMFNPTILEVGQEYPLKEVKNIFLRSVPELSSRDDFNIIVLP